MVFAQEAELNCKQVEEGQQPQSTAELKGYEKQKLHLGGCIQQTGSCTASCALRKCNSENTQVTACNRLSLQQKLCSGVYK